MEVKKLSVDKIEQNENSRVVYKENDLTELMDSMKRHGLLQPIGVKKTKDGGWECTFGNRRLVSARKLGWTTIDCMISDAETDNDRDILNIIENMKRTNTTVSEDGRMFQVLLDRGLSVPELAVRLGTSTERIELALEINRFVPKEFQKIIVNRGRSGAKAAGTIPATSASHVMSLRRKYGLTKAQTNLLFTAAKDPKMTAAILAQVGPLLKEGNSLKASIEMAERLVCVTLQVFLHEKQIKKLEKDRGISITEILMRQLEKNETLGVMRRAAGGKNRTPHKNGKTYNTIARLTVDKKEQTHASA